MNYTIIFYANHAAVNVSTKDRLTVITFEGVDFANQAMEFVCRHCMVQMGQIGV